MTDTVAPAADQADLDAAVEVARAAGELTLQWFRSPELAIERKVDGTPVTEADKATERFLREELARRYPGDGVYGEEEAETPSTTGRRWIVDPIDGTKAFTHGVPLYCNLLALEDEHGLAIGVINMPGLGETVYAGRGLGCFVDGTPARVSTRTKLAGSYLSTSAFEAWDEATMARAKASSMRLRTWGDGYGYALVATGRIEAMVDQIAELYDLAPMPVIIAEAGGRFTDLAGNATHAGGSGLATNGPLHPDLLRILAS